MKLCMRRFFFFFLKFVHKGSCLNVVWPHFTSRGKCIDFGQVLLVRKLVVMENNVANTCQLNWGEVE